MGKRSAFEQFPQDKYNTPESAVTPLLPHLAPHTQFVEPCVGEGYLVGCLKRAGHVLIGSYDLPHDARLKRYAIEPGAMFVTNPPWRRDILHPIIINLSDQAPTWLLIDADWGHTRQSIPYLPRLRAIVSVGRIRSIPNSPYDGKDNCAWHLFDRPQPGELVPIHFVGRTDSTGRAVT